MEKKSRFCWDLSAVLDFGEFIVDLLRIGDPLGGFTISINYCLEIEVKSKSGQRIL